MRQTPLPFRARLALVAVLALAAAAAVALLPPTAQPLAYHGFSDQRGILGIPNFWNVISNLPFLFVGIVGLRLVARGAARGGLPELRDAYMCFFLGAALVSLGSAYYHLAPDNDSLTYDRLPMTMCFMAFLAIMLGEHVSPRLGARTLAPLLLTGAATVVYWHVTERAGHGDLRPYLLVQFVPMALLPPLLLLFPSRLTKTRYAWGLLGAYGLAKFAESSDAAIYSGLGYALSGHTLKHLAAALGLALYVLALQHRELRSPASMSGSSPEARYPCRPTD